MKPFFVIAGMHRSGTSFLARTLNLSGVYLGNLEELDTGFDEFNKSNPMGQWENKKIVNWSDKILNKNHGSWDDPPNKIILDNEDKKTFRKFETELMEHSSFASGFKDPRSLIYFDSLDLESNNVVIAGIFRDPLKVAESLKNRDGLSYEYSLKLWNLYNEKLLELLGKHEGFLINFDWEKNKLISEIKKNAQATGLVKNIDLTYWFKNELLRSDKTFEMKHPLDKKTVEIFEKLKKRSENNQISKNFFQPREKDTKLIEQVLEDTNKNNQFFQQISEKNFEIIKKIKDENVSISDLLVIYYNRPDLQQKFPEVRNGEYLEIVKWARYVVENNIETENIEILKKHKKWYDEVILGKGSQTRQFVVEELKRSEVEMKGILLKKEAEVEELKRSEVEMKGILLKKEAEITHLLDSIQNLKNQIQITKKELKSRNQELKLENLHLESQLRAIQNSISHKITRRILNKIDRYILQNKILGPSARKLVAQNIIPVGPGKIVDESHAGYLFDDFMSKETLFQYSLMKSKPKISIVMPVYKTDPELLRRAINSIKNQYYDNWQLCICDDGSNSSEIRNVFEKFSDDNRIRVVSSNKNSGISVASNNALKFADGKYTILLDHDDELAQNALYEIVKTINENPKIDFIYSDEDKIDQKGNHVEPFFKPDWSPDLFFSYNYPIHVSVFKTDLLKEIGGFRVGFEGAQDYDLILRYLEKITQIVHIPKVLYSWRKILGSTALSMNEKSYAFEAGKRSLEDAVRRQKINAEVLEGVQKNTYRIKYKISAKPLVSILIPSRTIQNIKICVNYIFEKSTYSNFEIIVLDTSDDKKIFNFCKDKKIKHVKFKLPKFNFSKINNDGVEHSSGEYIIFLNDDTKVITPDWIETLLEHVQREDIGIAGSKLIYDDGTVQHAGTIIGINGLAGNYGGMDKNDGGYFAFAKIIRNCGAVTAGCMMMKKKIFKNIGRYDEKLANSWQDVDLCLRVLKKGKRIVYTPYSMLYHYEGKTRGRVDTSIEEQDAMRLFVDKNKDVIKSGDRFYNPNLSLTHPFKINPKLNEPLQILFDLYLNRKDLQQVFPNEIQNKFRSLIDWTVTNGVIADAERDNLLEHYDYYYERCSDGAKKLAKKFKLFLEDEKLQEKFPETFEGKFDNYLNYLKTK